MNEAKATIIVVDDDESMRQSLTDLLQSVGFEVASFQSVRDFLDYDLPAGPRCLVLDIRLPGKGGLDLQDELIAAKTYVPIVFITGHGDIPMSVRAMKGGAVEFLPKPFREQDLLDAIGVGLERDQQHRQDQLVLTDLRNRFDTLTSREQQIMGLVTSGLLNKQIAAELGVSEVTAKVHRGQVMRKMSARSLAELVRMADKLRLPGSAG